MVFRITDLTDEALVPATVKFFNATRGKESSVSVKFRFARMKWDEKAERIEELRELARTLGDIRSRYGPGFSEADLDPEDREAFTVAVARTEELQQLAIDKLCGWEGIKGEDDQELEYTTENRDRILQFIEIRTAIQEAWKSTLDPERDRIKN